MLRFVLLLILIAMIARAFWRVVDGVMEGLTGQPQTKAPVRRVQMARDPVCGTYVAPDHALALGDGSRRVYFCSAKCRDQYRGKTA